MMVIFKNIPALIILICALVAAIATFFMAVQSQKQTDRIDSLTIETNALAKQNTDLNLGNLALGKRNQELLLMNQEEIEKINEQLKKKGLKYDAATGQIIVIGNVGSINQSGG